ncbi:MAG TPA: C13 family peptidase, partial [Burkholderiaceae bacterium]
TLFKKRFDTSGHAALLINNPATLKETPIASDTSLQAVLDRVGQMMDRDKDILFLYMTSHGSHDHKFSLEMGNFRFEDLDPVTLRRILDASTIKRRVVVIAACYAGGFIDALKDDNTLVIAAAAPDKTSFGCSNEEDFTYFGRAYFNEALRKTDSFTDAFDIARPAITAREKTQGYEPSNPQMFEGAGIKHALDEWRAQRNAARKAQ